MEITLSPPQKPASDAEGELQRPQWLQRGYDRVFKCFNVLLSTTQKLVQKIFGRIILTVDSQETNVKRMVISFTVARVKGEGGLSRLLYLHTGQILVRVISYDKSKSFFSSMRPSVCEFSQGLREANLAKLGALTRHPQTGFCPNRMYVEWVN